MKMTDDNFAKLVAEEVKNKVSPANKQYLMEKDNWNRWERALVALVENLNNQLEEIASSIEADTERYTGIEDGHILLTESLAVYESRKKKIERFKFHVENRLVDVSRMIETDVPLADDVLERMMLLQKAIKKHKEMMVSFDIEPTPIDQALWSSLDGAWTFDSVRSEDLVDA